MASDYQGETIQVFVFRRGRYLGYQCFAQDRLTIGGGQGMGLPLPGCPDEGGYWDVYVSGGALYAWFRGTGGVRDGGARPDPRRVQPLDTLGLGEYRLQVKLLKPEGLGLGGPAEEGLEEKQEQEQEEPPSARTGAESNEGQGMAESDLDVEAADGVEREPGQDRQDLRGVVVAGSDLPPPCRTEGLDPAEEPGPQLDREPEAVEGISLADLKSIWGITDEGASESPGGQGSGSGERAESMPAMGWGCGRHGPEEWVGFGLEEEAQAPEECRKGTRGPGESGLVGGDEAGTRQEEGADSACRVGGGEDVEAVLACQGADGVRKSEDVGGEPLRRDELGEVTALAGPGGADAFEIVQSGEAPMAGAQAQGRGQGLGTDPGTGNGPEEGLPAAGDPGQMGVDTGGGLESEQSEKAPLAEDQGPWQDQAAGPGPEVIPPGFSDHPASETPLVTRSPDPVPETVGEGADPGLFAPPSDQRIDAKEHALAEELGRARVDSDEPVADGKEHEGADRSGPAETVDIGETRDAGEAGAPESTVPAVEAPERGGTTGCDQAEGYDEALEQDGGLECDEAGAVGEAEEPEEQEESEDADIRYFSLLKQVFPRPGTRAPVIPGAQRAVEVVRFRGADIEEVDYLEGKNSYRLRTGWSRSLWKRRGGVPPGFKLVRLRDGGVAELHLDSSVRGRIYGQQPGSRDLRDLHQDRKGRLGHRFRGAWIPLPPDAWAVLRVDSSRYLVRYVARRPRPAARPLRPRVSSAQFKLVSLSMFSHLLLILLVGLVVPETSLEGYSRLDRFARIDPEALKALNKTKIREPKKVEKPKPRPKKKIARLSSKAKSRSKRQVPQSRRPGKTSGQPAGSKQAEKQIDVTQAGVLGALGGPNSGLLDAKGNSKILLAAVTNLDAVEVPADTTTFNLAGIAGKLATSEIQVPTSDVIRTVGAAELIKKGDGTLGALASKGSGQVKGIVREPPRAKISIRGGMSREAVLKVVNAHLDEIRDCYERELLHNPGLSGKILMEWLIQLDGTVRYAKVKFTNIGHSSDLHICLETQITGWTFPKPRGGQVVVVTFPFLFESMGF